MLVTYVVRRNRSDHGLLRAVVSGRRTRSTTTVSGQWPVELSVTTARRHATGRRTRRHCGRLRTKSPGEPASLRRGRIRFRSSSLWCWLRAPKGRAPYTGCAPRFRGARHRSPDGGSSPSAVGSRAHRSAVSRPLPPGSTGARARTSASRPSQTVTAASNEGRASASILVPGGNDGMWLGEG